MARIRVLNETAAATSASAEELSQRILAAAKGVDGESGCVALEALAGQLHDVDPTTIGDDPARIAFWVNIYNALVLHCLCRRPLKGNLLFHLRIFDRVAYRIGAEVYPLNLIENGILRRNRRAPFRMFRPLRRDDPRLAAMPDGLDPRIHFALNCGAVSCPPIHTYDRSGLDDQLETATRSYLDAEAHVDPDTCHLRLPRLMRLYRVDFGGRAAQIAFAEKRLQTLERMLGSACPKPKVRYSRFDWTIAPGASDA